jgi:hypothetical protein
MPRIERRAILAKLRAMPTERAMVHQTKQFKAIAFGQSSH